MEDCGILEVLGTPMLLCEIRGVAHGTALHQSCWQIELTVCGPITVIFPHLYAYFLCWEKVYLLAQL